MSDFLPLHFGRSQLCTSQHCQAGQDPASPAPAFKEIFPSFWSWCPAPVPCFKNSGGELLQKEKATGKA